MHHRLLHCHHASTGSAPVQLQMICLAMVDLKLPNYKILQDTMLQILKKSGESN